MSKKHIRNYLRTQRLTWALWQRELGNLTGLSEDTISKCELEKRPPSAQMIIAAGIIFGTDAADLFPAFYESIVDGIGARALAMHRRLEGLKDKRSVKVRKLLDGIPSRVKEARDV